MIDYRVLRLVVDGDDGQKPSARGAFRASAEVADRPIPGVLVDQLAQPEPPRRVEAGPALGEAGEREDHLDEPLLPDRGAADPTDLVRPAVGRPRWSCSAAPGRSSS